MVFASASFGASSEHVIAFFSVATTFEGPPGEVQALSLTRELTSALETSFDMAAEQPEMKLPKFELKMLLFPALMLGTRQIDFKNNDTLELARQVFYGVLVLVCTIYFIIYQLVERKQDKTVIWVPPKPQPSLPCNELSLDVLQGSLYNVQSVLHQLLQKLQNSNARLYMNMRFKF